MDRRVTPPLAIRLASPQSAAARSLMDELSATLNVLTGDEGRTSFDPVRTVGAGGCFAIAYAVPDGTPLGCGALQPLAPDVVELKRLYARPGTQGVGAALLRFLEQQACACGYRQVWLSTRRVNLRAVAFYRRHGYLPVAPYRHYRNRP
ncbi:GNAT family N-acetyltransferase [Candidatus Sodalis endolongispinus]|uniref:GNAT family N-acetyltransferase n=1 Tax=Candidatus Sodalis endolongispinus TaxID=2812662 RepID=A0ABS5YEG4_9GAMM|nr:GNAT family N-acetyltransferase [Candidatus Sodalis endolongispinus]MBT9433373.1 GNAT family N-acetyltransferase [Candidatus Sodalis endolongispinus]